MKQTSWATIHCLSAARAALFRKLLLILICLATGSWQWLPWQPIWILRKIGENRPERFKTLRDRRWCRKILSSPLQLIYQGHKWRRTLTSITTVVSHLETILFQTFKQEKVPGSEWIMNWWIKIWNWNYKCSRLRRQTGSGKANLRRFRENETRWRICSLTKWIWCVKRWRTWGRQFKATLETKN